MLDELSSDSDLAESPVPPRAMQRAPSTDSTDRSLSREYVQQVNKSNVVAIVIQVLTQKLLDDLKNLSQPQTDRYSVLPLLLHEVDLTLEESWRKTLPQAQ